MMVVNIDHWFFGVLEKEIHVALTVNGESGFSSKVWGSFCFIMGKVWERGCWPKSFICAVYEDDGALRYSWAGL